MLVPTNHKGVEGVPGGLREADNPVSRLSRLPASHSPPFHLPHLLTSLHFLLRASREEGGNTALNRCFSARVRPWRK